VSPREHLLEVDVRSSTITWTYSPGVHDEATIRRLADRYRERLAELTRPKAAALPSPRSMMETHKVPGVGVAAIRGGEIVAVEGFGRLDARANDPVTPDTIFRVASVSKQVSALGTLALAAAGELDLDVDINSYLTSWQLPGAGDEPVTVRHLLANTAGLEREAEEPSYRPVPTALEALRGRSVRAKCPPGRLFEKNVNNYLVLQQLLEDLTGTPFPRLMREVLFEPLGMTASSFDPAFPAIAGRPVARGHDILGTPLEELGPSHPAVAAGGLWTTAGDLARAQLEIRRAHLGEPALITAALAEQMLTPAPGTLYGLSTVIDIGVDDVDFGSVGEFAGYFTVAMCQVRGGDGFVLLTNADGGREIARFMAGTSGGEQFGRVEPATDLDGN
jgi:CubicO group peptidase (beta-lactamase class C family)